MRATIPIPLLAVVLILGALPRPAVAGQANHSGPAKHYSAGHGQVQPVPLQVGGLSQPHLGGLAGPRPGIFTKPQLGALTRPHPEVFSGHHFGAPFKRHPGVFVRPHSWVLLPPPPGVKLRAPHIRPGWQHVPHVLRLPPRRHHVLPGRGHFGSRRPSLVIIVP